MRVEGIFLFTIFVLMKRMLYLLLLGCLVTACGQTREPQVVAHRGYWKTDGSAQNSISSLQNAGRIGAYGSEFDVNLTADGRLVVNHDFTYKGLTIYETPYDVLRDTALTLANGEIIPSLEEYFEASLAYPEMQLIFELKSDGNPEYEALAVPASVEAIRKYGVEKRIEFISFSLTACQAFAKLMPDNKVEYLEGDLSPAEVKEKGLNGVDYHYQVFFDHPEWVEEAHKLGMIVNTWTVDKEEDIRRVLELGVDQVTTNEPELAQRLIAEFMAKKK